MAQQVVAGDSDREQRGRARGLDAEARPFQVQLVRDVRREVVLVVPDVDLQVPEQRHELGVRLQVVEVRAHGAAAVHADGAGEGLGVVAGVLERVPGRLQEETMLGVEALRLARAEPEEGGVEQVDVLEDAACWDERRVVERRRVDARRLQLAARELARSTRRRAAGCPRSGRRTELRGTGRSSR